MRKKEGSKGRKKEGKEGRRKIERNKEEKERRKKERKTDRKEERKKACMIHKPDIFTEVQYFTSMKTATGLAQTCRRSLCILTKFNILRL